MEDVVIVGGGAAGLNAALVLSRARRQVLVVDAGRPRNAPASAVHGFISRDGTPPAELLATGRADVERYGGRVVTGEVRTIGLADDGFDVELNRRLVRTRRLIVATGLRDELPDLPGLGDRFGRDVLHCPYCHGWEVRDQPVGVLGWQPAAVHQALLVKQWSDDVILFADPSAAPLDAESRAKLAVRSVRIMDSAVSGLVVEGDALRGIQLADGTTVERAALFVPPKFVPNDALLAALGCERDGEGIVKVDATGRTTVPGVWAVGNVVDRSAFVVNAAADGARAGAVVNMDLVEQEISAASAAALSS